MPSAKVAKVKKVAKVPVTRDELTQFVAIVQSRSGYEPKAAQLQALLDTNPKKNKFEVR